MSCGGWRRRESGTSATTRSTTSRRARGLPSPQLVGTPERATLDLNALAAAGVTLVGRLATVRDGRALFSGGLRNQFALADLKMDRLLDTFDEWARAHPREADVDPVERFEPTRVPASSPLHLDLGTGQIRSIIWATGYRPDYSWLDVPVLDRKGHLRHDGGVVDAPGLYAIGLPAAPATQVHVHPRRRRRRARPRRAPRGLSRQPSRECQRPVEAGQSSTGSRASSRRAGGESRGA